MKEGWHTIGFVGVDSGSLMIGDPCYLDDPEDWNPDLYNKWICGELCNSGDKQSVEIEELCIGQAVAFSSGFGDGEYEVKALYKDYGPEHAAYAKSQGDKSSKAYKDIRIKEVRIILIEDRHVDTFNHLVRGKK